MGALKSANKKRLLSFFLLSLSGRWWVFLSPFRFNKKKNWLVNNNNGYIKIS